MKLVCSLFGFLVLISCSKEKPLTDQHHANDSTAISYSKPNVTTKTDTLFFFYENADKDKEYVLVHLLNQTFDKDSLCTADFKLDFIKLKKVIGSHRIQIKGFDQGSEWFGSLELDSVSSPLKNIHVGYPACGYIRTNFLFYADKGKIDLVHQWDSMSDSGWGSWGEVVSGTPQNFYFRIQSFSPDDNDEEMGNNEFSDSIHFELKNNRWVKTLLTPEGKTYRSKKLSFDEFHKS